MAKQSVQDAFDLVTSYLSPVMDKQAANVADEKTEQPEGGDTESTHLTEETTVAKEMALKNAKKNVGTVEISRGDMDNVTKSVKGAPKQMPTKNVDAMSDCCTGKEAMMAKQARAERLGNNILNMLGQAAEETTIEKQASEVMSEIEKEALDKGAEFAYWYARGRQQRFSDAMELKEASAQINPDVLAKVGGIDGLLDKAAAEDPASVLPPELAEAAAAEEVAPEAAMPAEGAGDEEAAMAQIAQVMAEAGITEEDLNQMMQQIVAAKQSGMSDEAIMQALSELGDEAGEGAGHEATETPEEEAQEEMAKTATVNHEMQVQMCKSFFKGN